MSTLFACVALLGLLGTEPLALQAHPPAPADTARPRATRRPGHDDVGSGDHLFFLPTARNLRRGEGYAQDLELAFLSANYGVTDRFSVGAFASVIPGQGTANIVGLSPKVSFPVAGPLRVGAGALLIGSSGGAGGIGYANATYGGPDTHVTAGFGYGATRKSGFINTPVVVLGGAVRVARRVSLVNESYFIYDRAFLDLGTFALAAGIAGVRVAGPRFGGSLGVLYAYGELQDSDFDGSGSLAYPFGEFTVRFGKIK